MSHVIPYLNFNGLCAEAIAFYEQAIGATPGVAMRFLDMPGGLPPGMVPPGQEEKLMHADFRVGDTMLMCSDGQCGGQPGFSGISLALPSTDEAESRRRFAALAEGGTVQMPLGPTFFSPLFGQVTDRFGVVWMVMVEPPDDGTQA